MGSQSVPYVRPSSFPPSHRVTALLVLFKLGAPVLFMNTVRQSGRWTRSIPERTAGD